MFGFTRTTVGARWKAVEGDFVLGACARRFIGFASRSGEGSWSAFDDHARPLGLFIDLADAQTRVWESHRETHGTDCTARGSSGSPCAEPSRDVLEHRSAW